MKPWQAGARFAGLPAKPWHGGAVAVKVAGKRDAGLNTRLVQFKLTEPEPLLYHAEPILRDGRIIGFLSSGGYGHHLGGRWAWAMSPARAKACRIFLPRTTTSRSPVSACGPRRL